MSYRKKSFDSKMAAEEKKLCIKKVLIVYTGGTFGMQYNPISEKLEISSSGSLAKILKTIPEFYDKKEMYLKNNDYFISQKMLGVRIFYKIHQFETLIDSSDSNIQFILKIN